MEPPTLHPNSQVEREMDVAEAPVPARLFSSSWWSVLDAEPEAMEPLIIDPNHRVEPKRLQDPGVAPSEDESQSGVKP
jgi:hypothetical protein